MSRPRVWVLGSQGRLGAALIRKWVHHCDLIGFGRKDCDISDETQVRKTLENGEFDWLVNCAAMTNVDACEIEQDAAKKANADGPGLIAKICARKSARMIHISTDYVFDGLKKEPYVESDAAHPLGVYGETKLAGENYVLAASPRHFAVRVSWVFGPEKPSFVDAMIHRAMTTEKVEAIDDKNSSPTFSDDIADWLMEVIHRDAEGGIYHACNSGGCTWREYAEYAIRCVADLGGTVKTRDVGGIPLESMKAFVARRPKHTLLSNEKLASAIGQPLRPWQEAVRDFVALKYHPSKK
jgi:dTDP-4-dehydrorhamnose reductase